jgi:hypothetical protein
MDWTHKVLHSDWGDTKTPTRDGGYETIAVLYSNLQPPALVDFADAGIVIADETMRDWFTPSTGVEINTTLPAQAVPAMNILFDVEGADIAELARDIEMNAVIRGTYFGAKGQFECTSTGPCFIKRETTKDEDDKPVPFGVGDTDDSTEGLQGRGMWTFTPDDDAMVMLPDQDWVAFGFWLTAPDDTPNGLHRLGVFHDGMDMYSFTDEGNAGQGLDGTATYDGAAAGYYVNGADSGLFTASSHLTAVFGDANENGMLSGRIDDFKDSMGAYIGSDTRAEPNDPVLGGESDWVLTLRSSGITGTGGLDTDDGLIRGSADGVPWAEGEWDAQFYGGGDRATTAAAPSGVGGTFRAITDGLSTGGFKGVIGAFGAELDEHTPAAPAN